MALMNPATRLGILRRVSILQGLRKEELFTVARRAVEVSYSPGTVVVRQGDPGDTLCLVSRGTLTVYQDDHVVGRLSEGDYFGEISLIDGEPRSATVIADEDVVLLQLGFDDFDALLNVPYAARVLMKNLARLVREAEASRTLQRGDDSPG